MGPVLDALRHLGGSAKPKQVTDWIVQALSIPKEQLEAKMKSGTERLHNQICWARQYLVWEGLLDGAKRGEWKLTDLGAKTRLSEEDGTKLYLKWVEIHRLARAEHGERKAKTVSIQSDAGIESEEIEEVEERELLGVIQGLLLSWSMATGSSVCLKKNNSD
jgi:restriction system protein